VPGWLRPCVAVVVTLLAAAAAHGAFLRSVPQTVSQPDGTVLHLFATGDEYYNWLHDADGYVVVRDPETGYLVYAVKVEGRLKPSAFAVGLDDPVAAGLEKGVMPDPRYQPTPEELFPMGRRHVLVRAQDLSSAPMFSAIDNIVVFIGFADEPNPGFNSLETYQRWFNSTAASDSSMRRYFLEASYNLLDVESTFYPTPSGSVVVSYRDAKNRSYYKPYDATTNPDGYTESNRAEREHTLLKAAVDSIASQVPSSLIVDANNDGYVDNVVFVVSGEAVQGDWANLLWPHRWALTSGYPVTATINGKQVDDYNFQLDGNIQGSGVLCHEMTHTLGAPDLYHYDTCSSAPTLEPVGRWDLMAEDQEPPQHMGAYMKQHYLGWISQIPMITTSGTYQLNPLTSSSNNLYRIASPNSENEYFVVEYRKRSFPFENSLPGSGLLVYRIKDDIPAGQWGNNCGPPDEVYIYRPGGTATANGTLNSAYFSSDAGRTSIGDTANPSSFLSSGYAGGLSITNIGAAGEAISFTVNLQQPCEKPGSFTLTVPANGASVPSRVPTTLSWAASAGASSYDVYFGSDQNPPVLGNQTETNVSVTVTAGASYFWKVAAKNACAQVWAPASGTWAFSVGTSGGITILSDDFEGNLSKWQLARTTGASATAWGIVSCKKKDGNGAAWCAAGGSAPQPVCTQYAPDQGTFMKIGRAHV
jgi:M6 family metalloprotease-like protein